VREGAETLAIIDPPRFFEMREWDCQVCGRETLKHPVFLSDGTVAGTGCAARLLGLDQETVVRLRDERAAVVRHDASVDAERAARYAAALTDYRAKGSAIVRVDPSRCDFNALRLEHARRDRSLLPPAAFAAWLASRIAELGAVP
jgi:hypothetical protein